jgi:hypothetical protein
VQGRILELSPLESVVSLDVSAASTISVKLEDSDSYLRDRFNTIDLHKLKVDVYLWNPKNAPSSSTLLFTGYINTPMVWSEGSRDFSFTIVSQLESYEIGYSVDMGYSRWIPQNLYGQPFPMVFGTVTKYPLMMLTEPPHLIIKRGIGFAFREAWQAEIDELQDQATELFVKSREAFLAGVATATTASGYNDGDSTFTPPDDFATYESLLAAANELYRQSAVYMDEHVATLQKVTLLNNEMETLSERYGEGGSQTVPFYTENMYIPASGIDANEDPTGTLPTAFTGLYEAGNEQFNASVIMQPEQSLGSIQHVETRNVKKPKPFFQNITQTEVIKKTTSNDTGAPQKFIWIDGGTTVRVIDLPITYVVGVGQCTVHRVYSKKNGIPVTIPATLYTVGEITLTKPGSTPGVITTLKTNGLISALRDSQGEKLYDTDEIWADVSGPVEGKFTDIVSHIVDRYTDLGLHGDFVTECGDADLYEMSFVYESNEDALSFLKKLAYQARVSLWVTNGVVKGRYLPKTPTPTITITPDDVLEKTLTLSTTSTEQIVTKYVAEWRADANKGEVNRYIVRHNLKKYGLSEQTFNFFAYTAPGVVEKIATYWAVQHATVYKMIRFQCPLSMIALEAQDPVELSGFEGILGCGDDIIGIVQSSVYNSSEQVIDVEVKLPIRLGELCVYDFAYPAETLRLYRNEVIPDYETGNPFEESRNDFFRVSNPSLFVSRGPSPPAWSGNPMDISDSFNDIDSPIRPPLTTSIRTGGPLFDTTRPEFIDTVNEISKYEITPVAQPTIPTVPALPAKGGFIVGSQGNNIYNVQFLGEDTVVPVTQLQIAADYIIPNGTAVIAIRSNDGYVMQHPVWSNE